MNNWEREKICDFLTSSALADHIGDVRDAEEYLWEALGFGLELKEARYYADDGYDVVKYMARNYDLPFPEYVLGDDD